MLHQFLLLLFLGNVGNHIFWITSFLKVAYKLQIYDIILQTWYYSEQLDFLMFVGCFYSIQVHLNISEMNISDWKWLLYKYLVFIGLQGACWRMGLPAKLQFGIFIRVWALSTIMSADFIGIMLNFKWREWVSLLWGFLSCLA